MADITINVHHFFDEGGSTVLDKLNQIIALLTQQGEAIMADLSALTAEVTENGDAVASAVSLLTSLSASLRDAAGDPAAIADLANQLDANTQALAAAVVANTPAAPPQ